MTALQIDNDPIDIPDGAKIRRPDPLRPYVAMSNRKRWSKCALSAVLPQLKTASGPDAEAGTEVHKVAEWALHRRFGSANAPAEPPVIVPPSGLRDFDYSARGVADWQATALANAKTYAAEAAKLFSDLSSPTICMVELKIEDVTIHGVRVFTIADGMFWNPQAKRAVSGDYKNGRTPVGVGTLDDPNPQCAGALVLWADQAPHLEPKQVGIFVYQPNTLFGDAWQPLAIADPEKAKAWLAKERQKLYDELEQVAAASASAARGELVDPTPGDHCTYCPSARWCPAAAAYGAKALDVEANRVAVVDWTPEEVMAIWSMRAAFKQFEEDLKERVRILHEKQHPAVTVKWRKGSPMWMSEPAAVEAFMMADRYDMLKPPAIGKAAGIIPDSELAALTGRYPDVPTFAAVDGKNPALAAGSFAKYLNQGQK